jgi:molybdopterin converting factor subunit 1
MMAMQVRVRYFAGLREATGREGETLDLPDGATAADVRALLGNRSPALSRLLPPCAVAVNRAYVAADAPLHAGDELVFIPPLGGG